MSYQVGAACYGTLVDAGIAACAQYSPVSTLVQDGAVIRTVSCSGADPSTGALNLTITSTPVDGSLGTSATVQQAITYSECQQFAYIEAAEVVFGAVLGLWVIWYGGYKVLSLLHWGRGDNA
jgi:hypothetical protein